MNRLLLVLGVLVVLMIGAGVYFAKQSSQKTQQVQAHLDAQAKKESDRVARQTQLQAEADAVLRQGEHSPNKPVPVKVKTPEEIEQEKREQRDARDALYAAQYDSERAVLASLKDPDSAKFSDQRGHCGMVNSKNGFGGYTGFKRYAYNGQIVVIEGENMPSYEMDKVWRQICT